MQFNSLVLRTFGGLSLLNGGRPIIGAAAQRGRLALLSVIAAAGDRGISRDLLLALFWPESDTERARGALKQALYSLRRDVGERDLTLGTTELRLNPGVIQSDIGEFDQALKGGLLESAVELYQGPFLDGIHLHDAPEFERWAERERDRLATRYRTALAGLARAAARSGDTAAAVEWWRKLAVADPLSASIAVSLMEALAASGDSAAALRHAGVYTTHVREDLDAAPDPAVSALADRIRAIGEQTPTTRTRADRTVAEPESRVDPAVQAEPVAHPLPLPAPAASRRRSVLIGAAVTVALVVVGSGAMAVWGATHRPLDSHRIVVTSASTFAATPHSDPLDALLQERLAAGIIETHLATVAPVSRAVLRRGAPPGSPLTAEQTRAIGDAAGARYVVHATYQMDGDAVLLSAQVTDAETGTLLGPIEPALGDRSAPGPAIEALRSRVMAALAARLDPKLESWSYAAAMPTNYESYLALRRGIDAFAQLHYVGADSATIAHFLASAALDTTSATPLVWAALNLVYPRDWLQADSAVAALDSSRRRFGPWDRALLDVIRAWAAGDLPAGHAAGHRLVAVVPNSEWSYVVAWDAWGLGRASEAIRVLRQLDPDRGWIKDHQWYWSSLFNAYHMLGDHRSELDAVHEALRRAPYDPTLIQHEVRALAALGRVSEVEERCTRQKLLGPGPEAGIACYQGIIELRAHGHPEAARRLVEREIASLGAVPDSVQDIRPADLYLLLGDYAKAERILRERPGGGPEDQMDPGLVAVFAAARGDRAEVERYLERFKVPIQTNWGPDEAETSRTRARFAGLLGDRDEAVNWMTRAFREGYRQRITLHWDPAFDKLRGYPAFEALIRPVDDPEAVPSR